MFHELKKYSNRKLYSTKLSKYVTLSDIVEFIRDGEEITVVSNPSNEDVTNEVLGHALLKTDLSNKKINELIRFGTC